MALRISEGLANAILLAGFKPSMDSCFIDIYTGTQPTAANDAVPVTATKLLTISNNGGGTGVTFDTVATLGAIGKNPAETWSGTAIATGTAGWFRVRKSGDTGAASTTALRIDGAIGSTSGEMQLGSDLQITATQIRQLTSFSFGEVLG